MKTQARLRPPDRVLPLGSGVDARVVTIEELEENQDFAPPADFDRGYWSQLIEQWNRTFPR